jgi:hypothetical protein
MKKYGLILLLFLINISTHASAFEMGPLGKARMAGGVIEVRVLASKDSSTWIKYPNGFNRKETTRIITKCVVLRSSDQNIKDTINLYFELSDYASYDSSGNLEGYCYPFLMHSGEEFKMKKDSIYSCFISTFGNRISLLSAETIPYNKAYKELFGAKKINQFIAKYDKDNARELEMYNLFYHVSSCSIDTVIFYHRIKKKFIQLTNSTFQESKEYELDVQNTTFYDENEYYLIKDNQKYIMLIKVDLSDLDENINNIENILYSEKIIIQSKNIESSRDSIFTLFLDKTINNHFLQQSKLTKDFFVYDDSTLNHIRTEYPNYKIHKVEQSKLKSLIKKGQKYTLFKIHITSPNSNTAKIHITQGYAYVRYGLHIRIHNYKPRISCNEIILERNVIMVQQAEIIYNRNTNTVSYLNENLLYRIAQLKEMFGTHKVAR